MLNSSTAFVLQGEKGSPGKNGAPGFIVSNVNVKYRLHFHLKLEESD